MVGYTELTKRVSERLSEATSWASIAPYERKGILFSEMLFLVSCLSGREFQNIIESGRARGQSTLLLSSIFPQHQILSIELNLDSEDVTVATKRLQDCPNVQLLYGDSRKLLPKLVGGRDIVLIDGPKSWRAIALSLWLFSTVKPVAVFIHDLRAGDNDREFVDKYFPESRFSDSKMLAEITTVLDTSAIEEIPPNQRIDGFAGEFGYGYSLGYIPYKENKKYLWLFLLTKAHSIKNKILSWCSTWAS